MTHPSVIADNKLVIKNLVRRRPVDGIDFQTSHDEVDGVLHLAGPWKVFDERRGRSKVV